MFLVHSRTDSDFFSIDVITLSPVNLYRFVSLSEIQSLLFQTAENECSGNHVCGELMSSKRRKLVNHRTFSERHPKPIIYYRSV